MASIEALLLACTEDCSRTGVGGEDQEHVVGGSCAGSPQYQLRHVIDVPLDPSRLLGQLSEENGRTTMYLEEPCKKNGVVRALAL